jgi:hypothetical protein
MKTRGGRFLKFVRGMKKKEKVVAGKAWTLSVCGRNPAELEKKLPEQRQCEKAEEAARKCGHFLHSP